MHEKRPFVGLGVIVEKDGKILIGKRLAGHGAGTYQIPGGHLEFGESFEACASREVLEESGVVITDLTLVSIGNDIAYEKHYVSIGMHALWSQGTPRDEEGTTTNWEWMSWNDLPSPMFPHSKKVIDSWLAKKIYNP